MANSGHKAQPGDEITDAQWAATLAKRAEKRAKLVAEFDKKREVAATTTRPGNLEEVLAAVKNTNLGYLFNLTPVEFTSRVESEFTVHEFLNFHVKLPAGTKCWLYTQVDKFYDKYTTHLDWSLPAEGAKVIKTTTYYSLVCIVDAGEPGKEKPVLASAFKCVDKTF